MATKARERARESCSKPQVIVAARSPGPTLEAIVAPGVGSTVIDSFLHAGACEALGVAMRYETQCVKIQLRPDCVERVRAWATTLNQSRRAEALATLRDETVVFEAAFLDHTTDGDFLIYIMKAESFEKAREAAVTSTHDIDSYHRQFKNETWESRKQLELLLDLDRSDEVGPATHTDQ